MGKASVTTVVFNSKNPEVLVNSCARVLGFEAPPHSDATEHIWLFPTPGENINSCSQRTAKNADSREEHFDVAVDDLNETEASVKSLGGNHVKISRTSSGFERRKLKNPQEDLSCISKDSGPKKISYLSPS